jgi:P4 family phage/plasmid primase-like protien
MVIAALLQEHWTQNLEERVLGYLQRLPEFASLRNHPEDDGWQHLVNFTNGLYDWRTGELKAHDPYVLSTWQLTVSYHPGPAPMWVEFLSQVLPPDMLVVGQNGVAPWQEDFGYLLLPGNPLHRSFLLRGPGRNGKGVWMTVLRRISGRFSALTLEDLSDPGRSRFRLVDLYGSPVNIAGEIDPGFLKNTAVFKQMTGGDEMTFEPKFKGTFKARVWAVPIFSANEDFRAKDNSVAFWDRWEVRHFPNVIAESQRDPSLAQRIFDAEAPQIAALAMEGLRALMHRGSFSRQPSSESVKDQFRRTSDHIARFIDERVTFTGRQKDRVTRDALTKAYQQWCQDEQERPKRSSELYAALSAAAAQQGLPEISTKTGGTRGFSRVTLEDIDHG